MYTIIYFVGVIIIAISIGNLTGVPEHGFLTLGGGLILYAIVVPTLYSLIKRFIKRS